MSEETTADIVARMIQEHAKPPTITITISREDGEWWHKHYEPAAYPSGGPWEAIRRVDAAIRAALQGER